MDAARADEGTAVKRNAFAGKKVTQNFMPFRVP
jgi:hypothetical protein